MSAVSIQPPYPVFSDSDGSPLDSGYIYLGTAGLEPETNPIQAYWDASLTIPATQPIRTLGGYPQRSGSPARLYVNSDCSIKVLNKNSVLIYSSFNLTDKYGSVQVAISPVFPVSTMAGLVAQDTTQSPAQLLGFHAAGDKAPLTYVWSPLESKANHDGAYIIDPSNAADLVTWDSAAQTTWFTAGTGTGCWVAHFDGRLKAADYGAKGDGSTDDAKPLQQGLDKAATYTLASTLWLDMGRQFAFGTSLNITTAAVSIVGDDYGFRQSGSTKSSVGMIWTGGASPMINCNKNLLTFAGFNVENQGTATAWLSLTTGAQNIIFQRLFFLNTTSHVAFSTATILSTGARLGYSQFIGVVATQPSTKFILIKDSSTTGLTPISFNGRCIFRSSGTFTVVEVDNSTLEGISFNDCTIIQSAGSCTLVDTTINPTTNPIQKLTINNCEFDADVATATDRFLKLENTINISLTNNNINGGGGGNDFADLINCTVSRVDGNYFKSLEFLLTADSTSKVRGIGFNDGDQSNTQGVLDNIACTYTALTQATTISMDAIDWGSAEIAHFIADITAAGAYTFALDISKPQNWEPGQEFILTIRNTSAGVVDAPLFAASTFNTQSTVFTAPATGKQTSIRFKFNGTEAQQISNQSPDINN